MTWRENKRLTRRGFRDLKYLPAERCGWDCTLAGLSYAARLAVGRGLPNLSGWAARHALPASQRYHDLGPDALVLWHGTSRERADKIAEHGLFHKRGLWTTLDPRIAHGYTRGRSERFQTEGAMVCLVLDRREITEGVHYDVENHGNILRFHQGLPPDVVEYVLVHEEIRFLGPRRVRRPAPWMQARFKRRSGKWVPVQKTPVRYSDALCYSTVDEFAEICLDRLLREFGEVTTMEVFSCLYACIAPWDALAHDDVFELMERRCAKGRHRGKFQTFVAAASKALQQTG